MTYNLQLFGEKLIVHSEYCDSTLSDDFDEKDGKFVNKICLDVIQYSSFKKMITFANADKLDKTMNLEYLNHRQLENKYRDLCFKLNEEKLSNLNLTRKNNRLTKQVSLHKRLMEIIASNDIPRLSVLIKVCVNNGMGVQSIISRVNDAIQGKYRSNYSEMEKSVATLVYRIGGPRLLHILHVSHGLLGVSTTFQFYRNKMQFFSASTDTTFQFRITRNTKGIEQHENKLNLI